MDRECRREAHWQVAMAVVAVGTTIGGDYEKPYIQQVGPESCRFVEKPRTNSAPIIDRATIIRESHATFMGFGLKLRVAVIGCPRSGDG